jgi:ribosomal protein L37AE/L43A
MIKNYKKRPKRRRDGDKKMNNERKCPHCGSNMRARGASDVIGGSLWKCRNKKCGRTVGKRKELVIPEPVVPTNLVGKVV